MLSHLNSKSASPGTNDQKKTNILHVLLALCVVECHLFPHPLFFLLTLLLPVQGISYKLRTPSSVLPVHPLVWANQAWNLRKSLWDIKKATFIWDQFIFDHFTPEICYSPICATKLILRFWCKWSEWDAALIHNTPVTSFTVLAQKQVKCIFLMEVMNSGGKGECKEHLELISWWKPGSHETLSFKRA